MMGWVEWVQVGWTVVGRSNKWEERTAAVRLLRVSCKGERLAAQRRTNKARFLRNAANKQKPNEFAGMVRTNEQTTGRTNDTIG
jgi:hypothetical protein